MTGIVAPLSLLCPTNEILDPEYLNGRKYYEFMISLNGNYSMFPCRKAFRLTYPLICRRFAKLTSNWLLFPELSDDGRFHYHACIERTNIDPLLLTDCKNYLQHTIGHTDGYTIDEGIHKATKPTDVAPCRCLVCRLTYMYKQQKVMKTVLRSQCPVTYDRYVQAKELANQQRAQITARANRRNLLKYHKWHN